MRRRRAAVLLCTALTAALAVAACRRLVAADVATVPGAPVAVPVATNGPPTAGSAAPAGAPAASVPPAPPNPFVPPDAATLTRLHLLIAPWLATQQVHLPGGTAPALEEPPGGWLPLHRIVAYYGNPLSPAMGVLAWYPPAESMAKLAAQAAAYQQVDPSHPVVPAIELVADVAQGSPGSDGAYRLRMPYSMLDAELALARDHHALLILDLQVGRSTVAQELPYYLPFLSEPDVELALDPEFDMPPGEVPGKWIGTMSAAEINWAVNYVSGIVTRLRLPPKMVIVHQFTPGMVPDWKGIRLAPGVQFIMDTDGYGGQALKMENYHQYIAQQPIPPVRYGGIKLFYKYDFHLMTPQQVVALQPPPSLVIYQ